MVKNILIKIIKSYWLPSFLIILFGSWIARGGFIDFDITNSKVVGALMVGFGFGYAFTNWSLKNFKNEKT